MLRITKTLSEEKTTLKLEGRVAGSWISEVERACDAEAFPLVLDLSGVTFADERAAHVIHRLRADGAELVGLSLFLDALIEKREP